MSVTMTPALTTPLVQRLRAITHEWFGLFPFRSPLLGESMSLSFPAGTEMGQFPAFPTVHYGFMHGPRSFTSCRFRI